MRINPALPLRARSTISADFGASRHPPGKARKGAHTRCMQPFAQRRRAGWIGVPKWVVIVERALSLLLALNIAHTPTATAQQVYRSVDAQGNVIYSDAPPADAAQTHTIELPPGPTEEQVKQAQQRTKALKESADKLASEREAREKIAADKRREEQERQRAAEQEVRLTRLEAMERNRDYWDYGAYYPVYPRPPLIVHPIEPPGHAKPLPGLPPVQGLNGKPLFRQHR